MKITFAAQKVDTLIRRYRKNAFCYCMSVMQYEDLLPGQTVKKEYN